MCGKIDPDFTFFLKGNLHDAWKSDKSSGGDDACHCSLASDRKKDRRWVAGSFVIFLCDR
jgi:hypothetical protein